MREAKKRGDLIVSLEDWHGPTEEEYLSKTFKRFSHTADEDRSQPRWVYDGGHISFYWKDVITYGLSGLRDRAKEERNRRIIAGP